MTKSDFLDWKSHVVTQEVFIELRHRAAVLTDELIEQTATMSQSEMAEKAGAIKAIRDVLNTTWEDISDGS